MGRHDETCRHLAAPLTARSHATRGGTTGTPRDAARSRLDPLRGSTARTRKSAGASQFDIAAADIAVSASGLIVALTTAPRRGSGDPQRHRAARGIEREHRVLLEKCQGQGVSVFQPLVDRNWRPASLGAPWRKGPTRPCHSVHERGPCHRDGFRLVQRGYADALICGRTEPDHAAGQAAFRNAGPPSTPRRKRGASSPWTPPEGFVVGKGRAFWPGSNVRCGTPWRSILAGFAIRDERRCHHLTAPPEDGAEGPGEGRGADDAGLATIAFSIQRACESSRWRKGRAAPSRAWSALTRPACGQLDQVEPAIWGGARLEAGLTVLRCALNRGRTINLDNPTRQHAQPRAHRAQRIELSHAMTNRSVRRHNACGSRARRVRSRG